MQRSHIPRALVVEYGPFPIFLSSSARGTSHETNCRAARLGSDRNHPCGSDDRSGGPSAFCRNAITPATGCVCKCFSRQITNQAGEMVNVRRTRQIPVLKYLSTTRRSIWVGALVLTLLLHIVPLPKGQDSPLSAAREREGDTETWLRQGSNEFGVWTGYSPFSFKFKGVTEDRKAFSAEPAICPDTFCHPSADAQVHGRNCAGGAGNATDATVLRWRKGVGQPGGHDLWRRRKPNRFPGEFWPEEHSAICERERGTPVFPPAGSRHWLFAVQLHDHHMDLGRSSSGARADRSPWDGSITTCLTTTRRR